MMLLNKRIEYMAHTAAHDLISGSNSTQFQSRVFIVAWADESEGHITAELKAAETAEAAAVLWSQMMDENRTNVCIVTGYINDNNYTAGIRYSRPVTESLYSDSKPKQNDTTVSD